MTNRLAQETSPYLLQHQSNPVDWYPWGEEALQRARHENKPIVLSIGYSACHWCHVMAHESFENDQIAQVMNEHFVNIKVDREERPDLDHIYQNVAQVMTQGGGWPLTVFLTPELKPFFGGTYFPPEDRYGRPGFQRVLLALADAFKNDTGGIQENAQKLLEHLQQMEDVTKGQKRLPEAGDFHTIARKLLQQMDPELGGFAGAPKFPNPMIFSFLWRVGQLGSLPEAKLATRTLLTQMASRGIYDQLGGGFHRYSVDATWSVPHFEKMLYDNALLVKLYSEVLLSGEIEPQERRLYLRIIQETQSYILREMTSPEGAFYSAQDADSEGEEGKFFVWSPEDLVQILTADEAKVFAAHYGVTSVGNFEHAKTVLFLDQTLEEIAERIQRPLEEVELLLTRAREKLFHAREVRIKPGLDNKIITSWNGLMISGLVWASRALQEYGLESEAQVARKAAERAFQFIQKTLQKDESRLASTYQGGQAKGNAYLDDYAFMAMAAIDLARFEENPSRASEYYLQCDAWIQVILKHFRDGDGLGYFFTSDDHERLIQRPKTIYDQAIPSGIAVTLECLAFLGVLDIQGRSVAYIDEVENQIGSLFEEAMKSPYGRGEFMSSCLLNFIGPISVAGVKASEVPPYPFALAKPEALGSEILLCQKRTCLAPIQRGALAAALQKCLSKIGGDFTPRPQQPN